jgi:hypothetical protein
MKSSNTGAGLMCLLVAGLAALAHRQAAAEYVDAAGDAAEAAKRWKEAADSQAEAVKRWQDAQQEVRDALAAGQTSRDEAKKLLTEEKARLGAHQVSQHGPRGCRACACVVGWEL